MKITINSQTVTLSTTNGAIAMYQIVYMMEENECRRIDTVTLHWYPGDKWIPACWYVAQYKGNDNGEVWSFESLAKAFKTFKSLLFNEEEDDWDVDITPEDVMEWERASVGLA